jgi:hypothetical protein
MSPGSSSSSGSGSGSGSGSSLLTHVPRNALIQGRWPSGGALWGVAGTLTEQCSDTDGVAGM